MHSDEDAPGKTDSPTGTVPVTDLHYAAEPAEPERLPQLRRALAGWAQRVGMSADQIEALALASYEALANAATHAYSHGGELELHATYLPERALVQVTIADSGRWRPPPNERGETGGRGLVLIRTLATHAEVTTGTGGTTVHMTWAMNTADTAPAVS